MQEEREERFHAQAEKEDPYDWRKRPSKPESRAKKLVRKLGTTGQIISNNATTGDDRTRYATRNGVTWRVRKTEKELEAERLKAEERERLRKLRSYAHRHDKGRPIIQRCIIKINLKGDSRSYYYGGKEIGWTTYECALQYLGKKNTEQYAMSLIKNMGLDEQTDRFDSVEVVNIPKECNKEWLFAEKFRSDDRTANNFEEETYETHEEYVDWRRDVNLNKPEVTCESCLCNSCGHRNPFDSHFCMKCVECKKSDGHKEWRNECEKYVGTKNPKIIRI